MSDAGPNRGAGTATRFINGAIEEVLETLALAVAIVVPSVVRAVLHAQAEEERRLRREVGAAGTA